MRDEMADIRNINKRTVYDCLKCENFKENNCILNKNIHLQKICKDFIPALNISKEKMIEMWENLQYQINRELITTREIQLLLIREEKYKEKTLPLNIEIEEIRELWKKTHKKFIQILEKNKRLHQLISDLHIKRNEREKKRGKSKIAQEFLKILEEE